MRVKYQTRASLAEEQVLGMLKTSSNIQKDWSLAAFNLENRTLQTTAQEAALIYNNDALVRPGYEQKEQTVFVPNLFIKLSGTDEDFSAFQKLNELKRRDNCLVFESFQSFPCPDLKSKTYQKYLKDGLMDKEAFLWSDDFRFSFLRPGYQSIYIEKINEILKEKENFFIGKGLKVTHNEILSTLFQLDDSFMQAFHGFDFQFQPPSVVIINKGKEKPAARQALILVLLNLLGFDIIVQSPHGHADIENIVNPELYCVFYGERKQVYKPLKERNIHTLLVTAAAIFLTLGLPMVNQMFDKTPVTGNQAVNTAVNDETMLDEGSEVIHFKDAALEKAIRTILQKASGDIRLNDIEALDSLSFIGPYAGGPGWSYINGHSSEAYYDVMGVEHTENGDIRDVSDIARLSGLYYLEISWQNDFNIKSLMDSTTTILTMRHNNVKDISVFSSMKNLEVLQLEYNEIEDLSPMEGLAVNHLSLEGNKIKDVEPLTTMKRLTYLNLNSNPVKNASVLGKITTMKNLFLRGVPIDDFNFLKNLNKLESLDLTSTGLTDASVLKDNTRLIYLTISSNNISDISSLKNLKELEYLDISGTQVRDISVLKELPMLRSVSLYHTNIEDDTILEELRNNNVDVYY